MATRSVKRKRMTSQSGYVRQTIERIELNPKVCNGKPVIKGTRIPVTVILEQLAEGEPWQTLLSDYPELTMEDIRSALHYANVAIDHSEFETVDA